MGKSRKKQRLPTDAQLAKAKSVKDLVLVRVYWKDACTARKWQTIAAAREAKLAEVISVGWLLRRTKAVVSIGSSFVHLSMPGWAETIPMSQVRRIEIVEDG